MSILMKKILSKFKLPEFYRYNDKELKYEKVNLLYLFFIFLLIVYVILNLTPKIVREYIYADFYEPEVVVVNIKDTTYNFSEDKLVDLLKDLNVKFPHIVLAQAKIESGNYTSKVFNENNNLFGMKEARIRIHTAQGTQYNHAYYQNWRESVYDYAFYQCRYLSSLKTEDEYYHYLDKSYAEAENYVNSLKTIVIKENLRALFE